MLTEHQKLLNKWLVTVNRQNDRNKMVTASALNKRLVLTHLYKRKSEMVDPEQHQKRNKNGPKRNAIFLKL